VARKHPAGDLRRPPNSCAHRLRKPDRTCELLALSVARWAQERGLRPTSPGTASKAAAAPFRGAATGHHPPRQARRCRRRFRTTATDEPERLPSDRLEPRGSSGLDVLVVHVHRLTPHPVARCEPGPASSKADWSPRATSRSGVPPFDGRASSDEKDASHRLLQPTPFTSTLRTVQFLVALVVTLHLAVSRGAPRVLRCARGALAHPGPEPGGDEVWVPAALPCRMSRPSGASLDGEPPASAAAAIVT